MSSLSRWAVWCRLGRFRCGTWCSTSCNFLGTMLFLLFLYEVTVLIYTKEKYYENLYVNIYRTIYIYKDNTTYLMTTFIIRGEE